MTIWDVIILTLAAGQLIALIVLGVFLVRLKNGPVLRFVALIRKLMMRGGLLASIGLRVFEANRKEVTSLVTEVAGIAEGVRYGTRMDFGDRISYASLLTTLGSLRSARVFLGNALGFVKRRKKEIAPLPGPLPAKVGKRPVARPTPRRSLVDRMGLVPPIARPLGRLWQIGQIALEVRRELQRRGIG